MMHFKVFHQKNYVENMLISKFYIFVLIANVNASVHSVLFMVYILIFLGKHKDHDVKTVRKSQPLVKAEM
jgi:hypothetical protein